MVRNSARWSGLACSGAGLFVMPDKRNDAGCSRWRVIVTEGVGVRG